MTNLDNKHVLTIVLATVLPVLALVATLVTCLCLRARRRRSDIFKRGATPIGDEEIESWKTDKSEEKELLHVRQVSDPKSPLHSHHQSKTSTGSVQKPASVIVYQSVGHYHSRSSGEGSPLSPRSLHNYTRSADAPQPPVLARAPNARLGLTDETVQGDDAYVPQLRRSQSRLVKSQSTQAVRHDRTRSARSSVSMGAMRDYWQIQSPDYQPSPRPSTDYPARTSMTQPRHHRIYSSPSNPPPRPSSDEELPAGGLSPRPLVRQSEIGRAIG